MWKGTRVAQTEDNTNTAAGNLKMTKHTDGGSAQTADPEHELRTDRNRSQESANRSRGWRLRSDRRG